MFFNFYHFSIEIFGIGLIGLQFYIYTYVNIQSLFSYFNNNEPAKSYDYVIVGSGTAGSIITYRLAQQKENILLLEAGPHSNFLFDIPALGPLLQLSQLDWQYATVPQKYSCYGLENNISRWPMGKLFGGTSHFNNMIHIRGDKRDFDQWFQNKSDYNFDTDILHYFQKLELSDLGGPLHVNNLSYESPLAEAIHKAGNILDSCTGFNTPLVNTKQNKRWSPSNKLLNDNFKNVQIITNAQVTKILFRNNYEAYAVKYNHLGTEKLVRARKGIVLSAGVIGSPKLLMLSGIGPEEHLTQLGIKVRKNLRVGDNLQDHVTTGLDLITLNQTLPVNAAAMVSPGAAFDYFIRGQGPWTSVGCDSIGFCLQSSEGPKLQFMVLPVGITSDGGKHLHNAVSILPKTWTKYFSSLVGTQVSSLLPIVLHPKSKGTIRLVDSNPNTPPAINPNYLQHPDDVAILITGIKLIKKLILLKPMQELGTQIYKQPFPGCENHMFDSDSYWECYVRHVTLTTFHPVGTCKMGHPVDKSSVVDFQFKVIGTNKLYVVDGSILPTLTSGNVNAAIAMMAEKAADVIKSVEYLLRGFNKPINVFRPQNICIK